MVTVGYISLHQVTYGDTRLHIVKLQWVTDGYNGLH